MREAVRINDIGFRIEIGANTEKREREEGGRESIKSKLQIKVA